MKYSNYYVLFQENLLLFIMAKKTTEGPNTLSIFPWVKKPIVLIALQHHFFSSFSTSFDNVSSCQSSLACALSWNNDLIA